MKRKQFLVTTITAIPALAFGQFRGPESRTKKPFVVRSGKSRFGEPMKYKGVHLNDVVISKKDTGNAFSVFAFTGYAKVGPSLHLHFHQDEFFYVAEGNYRFVAGDETMELSAGDTIFLPRNIPHTWIQLTDNGKLLYAVQPAGTLEEFFQEMNDLKKPLTEEEAKQKHLKHGMKLLGPGLKL
jgi:quercetin 2,3-dioxygenase